MPWNTTSEKPPYSFWHTVPWGARFTVWGTTPCKATQTTTISIRVHFMHGLAAFPKSTALVQHCKSSSEISNNFMFLHLKKTTSAYNNLHLWIHQGRPTSGSPAFSSLRRPALLPAFPRRRSPSFRPSPQPCGSRPPQGPRIRPSERPNGDADRFAMRDPPNASAGAFQNAVFWEGGHDLYWCMY